MKTFWTWLIGIMVVLVLLAAGMVAYQLYLRGGRMDVSRLPDRAWQNPMPGRGVQDDPARPDLSAGERPFRQMRPMRRDRAMMPFLFAPATLFGGLLRLLLPLAVLFGVGYLGYVLGKRSLPAPHPAPTAPPPQPAVPVEEQVPPAA